MKIVGIYKIINLLNGKYYVGSSSHIKYRWNSHRSTLNKGIHSNPHLQFSWNKYSGLNFKFEIVEIVNNEHDLLIVEQKYLNEAKLNRKLVYNTNFIADRPPQSESSRQKQAASMKGRIPWNKGKIGVQIAWNKGKKGVSILTQQKISLKGKEKIGEKNPNYNTTEHIFLNKLTKESFKGTQNKFRKQYNLLQSSVSYLVSGRYKSCNNWVLS